MKAEQIKSDTLSILLSHAWHSNLNVKQQAIAIARTCKKIRDKTKDELLYNACRSIIKAVSEGRYQKAIDAIDFTYKKYKSEYLTN